MTRALALVTISIAALLAAVPARAQTIANQIVADLSSREIDITTGFVGTDLLLFGAMHGSGDIVVVVRGPVGSEVVRRKERVAGIWVNRDSFSFANVPSFYRVATTRPLDEVAPIELRRKLQIGLDALRIEEELLAPPKLVSEYRAALIRALDRQEFFRREVGRVGFVEGGLFRTTIGFPANVRTGMYGVEVYLFRDGALISRKETPLRVRKVGLEAQIFRFAHDNSALYGIIAIAIALVAGWFAGVVFRKT